LQPIGRSFYSSDPDASANFVRRYLNAYPEANGDMFVSAPGSKTTGTYQSGWRCVFIQGHDAVMESKAKEVGQTWNAAMTDQSWTAWGDFHDGTFFDFNITNAMADDVTNWVYDAGVAGFARLHLPGTTYTHEALDGEAKEKMSNMGERGVALKCQDRDDQRLVYNQSSQPVWRAYGGDGNLEEPCNPDAVAYLLEQSWPIDEPGRQGGPVIEWPVSINLFKITYAVANASTALDFAKEVLGATERSCPFPYPPTVTEEGETVNGAKWSYVTDKLQMHFVESGDKAQHAHIAAFHNLGRSKAEDLRNGCVSAFFLNNMNFHVDTLDPFIDKLEERQVPYLATKNGNGDYALIFAFPGNEAVVVQLSSQHLTKAAARPQSQLHENC